MLKIETIVLSSLIEISKQVEEPHRNRRRNLLKAKDDQGYLKEMAEWN